jgi:hypothetical protein
MAPYRVAKPGFTSAISLINSGTSFVFVAIAIFLISSIFPTKPSLLMYKTVGPFSI